MNLPELKNNFIYLPKENEEMEKFLKNNKQLICYYVIKKINNSLENGDDVVELFGFVGTEYYVILYRENFKKILDDYFEYFLENEMYELCGEVKKVKEKLDKYIKLVKT